MSDHLDERIPRGGPWRKPKPDTPHHEQPEAKPYPAPYEHGFCPFCSVYLPAPGGASVKKLLPCDPASCQLGIPEENRCSIKDMAATTNALYLCHANQDASNASFRQLVKELSDRLGANLQSIHNNTRRLTDLASSFDESPVRDTHAGILRTLQELSLQLAHVLQKLTEAQTT